jgi:predicted ATPase
MSTGPESVRPTGGEDWSPLEGTIKRFVSAWRQRARPAIDDYVPADKALRNPVLIELIHTELELRLKDGEAARVEEYLSRYPELAGDSAAVLELIGAEYELRQRREPELPLDEYVRRFPQFREQLPEQIVRATVADRGALRRTSGAQREVLPEVPGYEILAPLGRGAMGVVYRARQQSLGRLVALKFLPEEYVGDSQRLERFRREARTASALNHPHICTIYDTGECGGRPFLSMELIEGHTLEELLRRRPSLGDVARLVGQAARALAAAHAAGVVHRDVKPANLMVRADGIVKVLDFGLARRLPACGLPGAERTGRDTDPNTPVGTPLYMSPEQARGERVDSATDIFALGVVLYELVTGQHPFPVDTTLGLLYAIVTREAVAPTRLNPEVPAALDALIQQMLAKDARRRPTAAQVDAVLTDLSGEEADRPAGPPPGPGKRPTVGRRQERAALRAAFEAAAGGRGSVLCVTGEPGLGKTTVVEDFLDELAAEGRLGPVARGRCSERLAGTEAYLPFLEALDSLLRGTGGAVMAQVMKRVAPTWHVQFPALVVDGSSADRAPPEATEAPQERLKRELAVFLSEIARSRPLVLFLDDVHWADASTVDLLAYLGSRCAGQRLLVLLTYRPADLSLGKHPFGPVQWELQGRGLCREVPLDFLGQPDVERYLALRFPGHNFPAELATVVHRRTSGNPLFLVALLQDLCEREVIVAADDGWALAQAVPDLQREMPASIRGLIQRKLDRLDESDRRLLMAASVQGAEFDSAVVAQVLGRDAADVEERLEALDRVHGLVRWRQVQEFPDGTLTLRYQFVHVLYQNALSAAVQPTRKAAWSAAVAQALLSYYGEHSSAVAGELALLFEAARDPVRAIEFFLVAARNAVRVSAHREAAELARRGLALLPKLPDMTTRAQQELTLLLALGVSLMATQGFASPEVEQTYLRARALCKQADDINMLFPVLYGLWNLYLVRCELPRCIDMATQMLTLAIERRDPGFILVAHNVLQQPLFHMGEFAVARQNQEKGSALYDPQKHRILTAVYGEDPGFGCLVYGAVTLWHLGYPEQALRSVQAFRSLAEGLSNAFDVAQALYYGAIVHLSRRETVPTQELAGALMDLCREQGFALLLAGGMILHGWSLTEQGQLEEGLRQMRQGLAAWQDTGALSHRPYHLSLLAEVLAREGQVQDGLTALAEAQTLAEATGERFHEAELHRLRGELLLKQAVEVEESESEACFRRAFAVASRQRAKPLELRAAMSLCRLYQSQGRGAEARPLLAESYGWFTEGFNTPDLQEARAILESQA